MAYVLATGFDKRKTEGEIKMELQYNILRKTSIQYSIKVEKEPGQHKYYNNFRISCFCTKSEIFMDSTIWPKNVQFKWYSSKRREQMDQNYPHYK